MRICFIAYRRLLEPLRDMGHETLCLDPPPDGDLDLPQALERAGFVPDLVVDREHLRRRFLVQGLDGIDCPVAYWSLDTHLNFFWQRRLAPLYDLVLTTQPAWVEPLRQAGAPRTDSLTWPAASIPWTPWAERSETAVFIGRLSAQRPARTEMVRLLERGHGLRLHDDVPLSRIGDVYRNARLVPNETIAGEVNLRLFEAAASGCLPLSPSLARDQEEYFAPGREFLPYGNAPELLELLRWCEAEPGKAETMGRRAWERCQAEHLPVHRAARLLELARTVTGGRARGEAAERFRLLALCELWQGERVAAQAQGLARRLEAWPRDAACVAARIALNELTGQRAAALEQARHVAAQDVLAADPECALAASALAWRTGDQALARFLLARCLRLREQREAAPPTDESAFWAAWGGLMRRAGVIRRPGFAFNEAGHLPATAGDCLHLARLAGPDRVENLRRQEELLRTAPESAYIRTGLLAELALLRPDDWRLSLDLGLAELQVFRLDAGLKELRLAASLAARAGCAEAFRNRLIRLDLGGSVRRALEAAS